MMLRMMMVAEAWLVESQGWQTKPLTERQVVGASMFDYMADEGSALPDQSTYSSIYLFAGPSVYLIISLSSFLLSIWNHTLLKVLETRRPTPRTPAYGPTHGLLRAGPMVQAYGPSTEQRAGPWAYGPGAPHAGDKPGLGI